MGFFGVIALVLIIRWLFFSESGGSRSSANSPGFQWYFLTFPLICFISWFLITRILTPYNPWIVVALPVVGLPSWLAQITIRLGLVQISYFLGHMALFVHYRDPFGGALFYGWQALSFAKVQRRERDQRWLEERLSKQAQLRSGAMLMHIFFKLRARPEAETMAQLLLMRFSNKQLIPGSIARYASRWMLARALATNDWEKIGQVTKQWSGKGWNPLVGWIEREYWIRSNDLYSKYNPGRWIFFMFAGSPSWKKYLPVYSQEATPPGMAALSGKAPNRTALLEVEWWLHNKGASYPPKLKLYWQRLLRNQSETAFWSSRIEDLGGFNKDAVLHSITESVNYLLAKNSKSGDLDNEAVNDERDKAFKLLRIKINAANNRINRKALMSGDSELEEWLGVALLIDQLMTDEMSESQLFHMVRDVCWQWVADLWNNENNKPLAYLISAYMSPIAKSQGDNESGKVFKGIISDMYK